jgi:tetratricopeptide (TPR) repeat protein/tRNA A-37 threonylcarbamoyl transferase component Bud32
MSDQFDKPAIWDAETDPLAPDARPFDVGEFGPATTVPERIGRYVVKGVIGSGGMGTVFRAVQEDPRRQVALKVMKRGVASEKALRRFQSEAQLLARLRHPNIAQIYEASTHDDGGGGVPYFAMEYVPGARPITQYAREHGLSTNERLRLFSKVCHAVHHGHQKGIIHRDLKPGNILVDADGEPKIIDFGVARSTDSDLALTTLQTDIGQLIGTLQYMSPEQCEADPDELDIRSDVYALGVVLYQLLCGVLPYDVTRLALHEAARVICDETPLRPSHHSRRLRGDVETISLKALEKERRRRYQSAADLGRDIERYLSDEPIEARPPTLRYQLTKFARRNRGLVAALATVAAVLIVATVISLDFALAAQRERRHAEGVSEELRRAVQYATNMQEQAEENFRHAVEQTKIAEEARRRAEAEAANAEAMNEFLTNDLLAAVAPSAERGQGRDVLMRDVLDAASERIEEAARPDGRFAGKPLIEASVRAALGRTYRHLGEHAEAELHLGRARRLREANLGAEHEDTLRTFIDLANLYYVQGRFAEAEELYRFVYHTGEQSHGLRSQVALSAMTNLASVYRMQGRYEDAEALMLKALEAQRSALGVSHRSTLGTMNNLANVYWSQGRYADAEPLYREAVEVKRQSLGPEHPSTLLSYSNLASVCERVGRYAEAESIHLEVLSIRKRILGAEHPRTVNTMSSLATVYRGQGRLDEAEVLVQEALVIRQEHLGPDHPDTLRSLSELATVHLLQERYADAEPLLMQALEARTRVFGAEHPRTLEALSDLATLYSEDGRHAEAELLMVRTYEARKTHSRRGAPGHDPVDGEPGTPVCEPAEVRRGRGDPGRNCDRVAAGVAGGDLDHRSHSRSTRRVVARTRSFRRGGGIPPHCARDSHGLGRPGEPVHGRRRRLVGGVVRTVA